MCRFLSAIVWSDGKIFCDPEHTDSHSDLIAAKGLDDSRPLATRGWVRVEFTAEPEEMADPDAYSLTIDESSVPAWLDNAKRFEIAEQLRDKIRAMIVTDDRDILLGGCWILAGNAKVKIMQRAVVKVACGSSQVGTMRESSQVGTMRESSQVGTMRESSQVGTMWESSQVGTMWGSSQVGTMWESSQVGTMRESSQVGTMRESSQVGEMLGSSQVGTMWGSSQVGTMWGSSQVGEMLGSSQVKTDKRAKVE